jgi:DNA helicase HerA-like ATPase
VAHGERVFNRADHAQSPLGEGVEQVNVLPGSLVSGETVYATVELVGFKDPQTGEIRMPRRALGPGAKVFGVDCDFLRRFYTFSEETSIHIGNLVGYESGPGSVPIYLDVNTLASEHVPVLAMTGSGSVQRSALPICSSVGSSSPARTLTKH